MKRLKNETLSIRTSSEIKELLRQAAEREHRSASSMVETLVLQYAREHGFTQAKPSSAGKARKV